MTRARRYFLMGFAAAAALSAVALLFFLFLPSVLAPHQRTILRVKAKFSSPEDEKQRAAEARAFDEPYFESLYDVPPGGGKLDVYAAPRGSFAYSVLSGFGVLFKVDKPVAASEDFLPSPPAPQAGVYVDELHVYPMQVTAAAFFIRWSRIAASIALVFFSLLAWFARARKRVD